jgi:MoxR-like ATPase
LKTTENQSIPIRTPDGLEFCHLLSNSQRDAIYGAIAANRPLLVRGEPGLGKSQLALAASSLLNRPYKSFTIDSHTEARDLLYSFDAVQRLAEAQVAANYFRDDRQALRKAIRVRRFVSPGPLWWAVSWTSANKQQKIYNSNRQDEAPVFASPQPPGTWEPKQGIVILIDEIDKADSSLPNGLLEVLGSHQFLPVGFRRPITSDSHTLPPLIVITTNRERAMPPAFLRRCLILDLALPKYEVLKNSPDPSSDELVESNPFIDHFVKLGQAHFGTQIPENVYRSLAELLHEDRRNAEQSQSGIKPGPAEYIDLLRAMHQWIELESPTSPRLPASTEARYDELCNRLKEFFFSNKYREF